MNKQILRRILALTAAGLLLILPSCREKSVLQESTMTQQEFFSLLPSLAKNTITVNHTKSDGTAVVGQSKIGGTPDLPAYFVWPTYYGMGALDEEKAERPLTFMAQINLSDVHPYDADNLLPESGMLYFFYDMETMRWGYDPEDKGCCRVYHVEEGVVLSPAEIPEELAVLPERILTFGSQVSYPAFDEVNERFTVEWSADSPWRVYGEELTRLGVPETEHVGMNSQLLGYPELVQNSMLRECELASTGTYTGNGFPGMTDEEKSDLAHRSREWILLFQMGSILDGEDEIMFGDLGSIFFCIRREDLAARKFEKVWLILQC